MKNLNKRKLGGQDFKFYDEPEIPLFLIKNLKRDLELTLKKYVSLNDDSLCLKIKILKENKYVIEVNCLTDFLLSGDNI